MATRASPFAIHKVPRYLLKTLIDFDLLQNVVAYGLGCHLPINTTTPHRCCRGLEARPQSSLMADRRHRIVLAYRHIYQLSLRAVHYSKPARFTILDRLRRAFREGHPNDYDPKRIRNTCQFLYCAYDNDSLEHKVLRSLLFTWYWEPGATLSKTMKKRKPQEEVVRKVAKDQFNHSLKMLNESMGMCLR